VSGTGGAPLIDILGDLGTAAAVAAAAFAGAVASALTGSGGAVLVSLALAPVIGVAALVQTISVAMVVSHAARIAAFRHAVDWLTCALVLASAVPACIAGAVVYTRLNETAVAVVLGLFLTGVVAARRLLAGRTFALSRGGIVVASAVFGLVSGATIGGGILVLPILMGAGLAGMPLVATDAVIGLVLHFVKMVVFGTARVLTPDLAIFGLIVGACMIPGVYVARLVLARMPLRVHAAIMDAVIAAGGVSFLVRGVGALW
jgi:uncharacterized protein